MFVKKYDPAREEPAGRYRIMLELFLADNPAVDAKYEELVGFGYHGRSAPVQTSGPYAVMVDDPDRNMILIPSG